MNEEYKVKLRKEEVDFALNLVDSGLPEWLEDSVEFSFDSFAH